MSLTLPIQVGKQYVRRDGAVRLAESSTVSTVIRVMGGDVWAHNGRFRNDDSDHPFDLIADHIPATGHPHAALMAQYAADAAETAEPWKRWERTLHAKTNACVSWQTLHTHPGWLEGYDYRRKPKTIRIGEHDVPEPVRATPIERGADYWLVDLVNGRFGAIECTNFTPSTASEHMAMGLVHLTREAAEQHARALLAFTQL